MKPKYLVVTKKLWNIQHAKNLGDDFYLITDKKDFTIRNVGKINPRFIFIPHWHWMIPSSIFNQWDCVVFHMTDLPFGRGGNPYENLRKRGIEQTVITAFKANEILDGGPVYIKQPFTLSEDKETTLRDASDIIFNIMIPFIVKNNPIPKKQEGDVVEWKRIES